MLVLSRKSGEKVQIGHEIILTIKKVRGNRVVISIDAPKRVSIHRTELQRFADDDSSPGLFFS
jgi:carbon storage regulator